MVKRQVADRLMYRHWNALNPEARAHLFVIGAGGNGVRDVTPHVRYDIPPGPFGGSEGYAFSPDGRELAYTAKDQRRADAWSTDVNLYTVKVDGGTPVVITASNRGADQNPVYSPDGRTIIYGSQATPGYESDLVRLMAYDRASGNSVELLPGWDRNADSYAFSPDGNTIYLQSVDASHTKLYRITRSGGRWTRTPQLLIGTGNNTSLSVSGDGRTLAWLQDAANRPAEVYVGTLDMVGVVCASPRCLTATSPVRDLTAPRKLTHENDALLAQLKLNPIEDF